MPNSQTKLKKVEEAASGVYDYESAFEAITDDRQDIERVLVESLRVRQSGWLGKEEDGSDRHPCYDELEEAITLVKEVLQGKE